MKIVFLGDSLTYAYGLRRKDAWVSLLAEITGFKVINKGISGDTTGGMLARFMTDVINEKPDMVHILGGGNDFICELDINSVKSNIMAMVHQALAYGIKPIVGTIPEIKTGKIDNKWSNYTNFQTLKEINNEYGNWIRKFSSFFKNDLIDYAEELPKYYKKGNVEDLYIDGIHFNEEGNILLAEIFVDKIKKII